MGASGKNFEQSSTSNEGVSGVVSSIGAKARDTVSELGEEVQARASDVLGDVREHAGDLQATVADALDSGAERIRQRIGADDENQVTGVAGRVSGAGEAIAEGLERAALWLRENDLTDLGTLIRQQLKEHPGRTALVALGLGIVLGRGTKR